MSEASEPGPDRGRWIGWLDSPVVVGEHVMPLIAGGPSEGHWLLDCFSRYPLPRDGAWLSLQCGGGGLELLAAQRGLFDSLEGFDSSPEAVQAARAWVAFHGVAGARFEAASLPDVPLPEGSYDVVLSQMSLHRLPDLDAFLERLRRALRPGAWLLLNEYVGPRYFQYTDRQLVIVEELLATLPPRLRMNRQTGTEKRVHHRVPVEHFLQHAPDEAVSSERIVAAIAERFEVEAVRGYGGSLLEPLLQGIVGNFDPAIPEDMTVLRLLLAAERLLLQAGVVQSDFALLVARQR